MIEATGLLWCDDSDRPLAEKLPPAICRFREKFGQEPGLCFVNPAELKKNAMIAGLRVVPAPTILRSHLFLVADLEKAPDPEEALP